MVVPSSRLASVPSQASANVSALFSRRRMVLVVEGKSDEVFFRRVLRTLGAEDMSIAVAHGWLGVEDVTRRFLQRGFRAMAVFDSDTSDTTRTERARQDILVSLSTVAPRDAFDACVLSPSLERVFFDHDEVLRERVERILTPERLEPLIAQGLGPDPKRALTDLLVHCGATPRTFVEGLELEEIRRLVTGAQLASFVRGLRSLLERRSQAQRTAA